MFHYFYSQQEPLLATVKKQKLACFGHVTRHDSLSKTILQSTMEGRRRRGRQRKCWMDNVKLLTSHPMPELLTMASHRKKKKRLEEKLCWIVPHVPQRTQCVTGLNWTEPNWTADSFCRRTVLKLPASTRAALNVLYWLRLARCDVILTPRQSCLPRPTPPNLWAAVPGSTSDSMWLLKNEASKQPALGGLLG